MPADQPATPAEVLARCAALDVSLPEQLAAFWSETGGRNAAFRDAVEALGDRMVAIMPDRAPFAGMLRDFSGCNFPFLTDADNGYAMTPNLVFRVGKTMMIAAIGNDVPRDQGNGSWLLPIPATFVVGRDGIVAERFVDPDYRARFAVEALVEAVGRA